MKHTKDHIILIGFMGCGKSTVGIRLSYRMRRPMVDTDKLIEREQECSISEIFAKNGEAFFRELETKCLHTLLGQRGCKIISVGGGLPLKEENRRLLKELGFVVYLRATADTVYERVKHDTSRPLLQGADPKEKIRTLMADRTEIYEQAADVIIDVDGKDFDTIMDEIQDCYQNFKTYGGKNETACN